MNLMTILNEVTPKNVTLYHGLKNGNSKVSDIQRDGLISKMGYDSPEWFMVATDIDSAIYHANPSEKGGDVYVVELSVPFTNKRWVGDPFLWPEYKRSGRSAWYALKQPLGSEYVVKVHKIPHDQYITVKNNGL